MNWYVGDMIWSFFFWGGECCDTWKQVGMQVIGTSDKKHHSRWVETLRGCLACFFAPKNPSNSIWITMDHPTMVKKLHKNGLCSSLLCNRHVIRLIWGYGSFWIISSFHIIVHQHHAACPFPIAFNCWISMNFQFSWDGEPVYHIFVKNWGGVPRHGKSLYKPYILDIYGFL